MGDNMFGITTVEPSREDAKVIRLIAAQHGVEWIEATLPGTGYQAWFVGHNRGFPFDMETRREVMDAIKAAGIHYGR